MLYKHRKILAISLFSLTSISSANADRTWDDANAPSNFNTSYIRDFNRLPLNGEMEQSSRRGWADTYWPKVTGSIANRWQLPGSNYKKDKSPSYFQLAGMNQAEIDLLSPAEKFDLARGKLNFPIATKIRKDFKENEKDWRGLCNGWTHASLNYAEPNPIIYIDPKTNRKIPFGSSDIKGLLAHYHANIDDSGAKYIGRSCRPKSRFLFNLNGACSDVHPAALHIMMANELGIKHQGFAADRDPSVQVWNQPFVKFESRIDDIKTRDLSKKATEGTRKEVYITSTLTYVNELYNTDNPLLENSEHSAPSYIPVLSTQKYKTIEYKYLLELNYRDQIIGGEWISGMRPDLIWRQDFKAPGLSRDEENNVDDWSLLSTLIKMASDAISNRK